MNSYHPRARARGETAASLVCYLLRILGISFDTKVKCRGFDDEVVTGIIVEHSGRETTPDVVLKVGDLDGVIDTTEPLIALGAEGPGPVGHR